MTELKQKLKETTPDAEVVPRAKRRQFSVSYKLRILAAADECRDRGEIGALLRREGLYSSHLSRWRQLRRAGRLGKKEKQAGEATTAEVAQLRQENERLQARLAQAELVIEVQKKISQLLGLPETGSSEDE